MAVAMLGAACGSDPTSTAPAVNQPTQTPVIIEKEVTKFVEVETEKQVEVTKEVQVEVTKVVQVVATPTPAPKDVIIFSDLNWDSIQLQNRIAMFIVENGYGYPVDTVTGNTISGFVGLEQGDMHVTMEIWLPNQQVVWDKAIRRGDIQSVGSSLDDNWQSAFVIPTYVAEANPGLKTVADLKKPEYMNLFVTPDSRGKARLVTCVPGWECEKTNENKIVAYGLEDVIDLRNPGSGAGLFADLEGAYQRGDNWLGYLWGPTKPAAELDLTLLEEPEYSDACWAADQGCAYPSAAVLVAVHSSLPPRAPDVVEFLRNWDFTAAAQVSAEGWMADNNESVDAAALWYLANQQDIWTQMVPADVASKIIAALP
ncbi:MAG: glycine betaine/proline transport system substrate-binding protein [Chloroflexi bacterium]|nr:MAG: glycine betaine/proline transport system substrate-binding protein [Chloroflexota bacterium]